MPGQYLEPAYERAETFDEGLFAEPVPRDPSKGRANTHAAAAWDRASLNAEDMRALVLELVRLAGERGLTAREFCRWHDGQMPCVPGAIMPLHCVSGRFSELARAGLIRQHALRVEGCGVWTLAGVEMAERGAA